ncbi:hypothetical protein DYU11_05655 [Fibrisoma montanum]|uniref:Transporter n=1 Tax=Fibrisoma montanum TaxID=2305895 RepID=A0A418MK64_9BACT|nr:hypothetical protein [Fibrisoma montanum]RIV27780.1 hypothetical protein DYU11_05655 [Fibrisoma montanum]
MKLVTLFVLAIFFSNSHFSFAQSDTVERQSYHNYFVQQSALIQPKGTLLYNNTLFFINSVSYNVTDRLTFSGGFSFLPTNSPPSFVSAKYVLPVTPKLFLGISLAYVRIGYRVLRSDYFVVPQLLVTGGDLNNNLTFSIGTTRGNYVVDSFFAPAVNLPERVNVVTTVSYQKRFWKEFSFITQNSYVTSRTVALDEYSELALLSAGAAWQLNRSAVKFGLGTIHYPRGAMVKFSSALPFLGYTLTIR